MNKKTFSGLFQWILLGMLWILSLSLGVTGWMRHSAWHHLPNDIWDNLFLTAQLVSLDSGAAAPPVPLELNIARFALPILTLVTAMKAFFDLFKEQICAVQMRSLSHHLIICGLSRKGFLLVSRFRERGEAVVVIEHDEENDWIESCREQGAFVVVGDAADPTLLRLAGVTRARGLFAVCDNDGINADIAMQARALSEERRSSRGRFLERWLMRETDPLVCLTHIADPQLCDLLRAQDSGSGDPLHRIELFNVFEQAAHSLLRDYPVWNGDLPRAGESPQVLLVGLGRMGENLLLHAARDWRARQTDPACRLRVTVIDHHALAKTDSLEARYPELYRDCEVTALQMEIRSANFERAGFLLDERGQFCIDRVYVCVDDDALGLHAGLTLLRRIPQGKDIPIVIRMTEEAGLAKLLDDRKNHSGAYRNLFAFGYLDHTCTPDLLERLAQKDG
jgi:hypothetical protein